MTIDEIQQTLDSLREKLYVAERRVAQAQEEISLHRGGKVGPVSLTTAQKSTIKSGLDKLANPDKSGPLDVALGVFLA